MPRFDKSKLPSRHVTEGPERAPHRSYYYAMGLTEEEIARFAVHRYEFPGVDIATRQPSLTCPTTLLSGMRTSS